MKNKRALKDENLKLKQYICEDVAEMFLELEQKKEMERNAHKALLEKYNVQSAKILQLEKQIREVTKAKEFQKLGRAKIEVHELVAKGDSSLDSISGNLFYLKSMQYRIASKLFPLFLIAYLFFLPPLLAQIIC